ncbi:hypothetical protein QCA50_005726 [Cerrena zonata]|uniref:F-box domain-containing protein n=1 Tax=Cerrena zonata TaxID=2478898 RepID=A0AAW0GL20_9APHY
MNLAKYQDVHPLPVEIAERIIDYLGDQVALNFHDAEACQITYGTLLNCALVCRACRIRSLRNLYRSIRLDPEDFDRHGRDLLHTIKMSPDIRSCVRAWAICELPPSSSFLVMSAATRTNTSTRALHFIGCQYAIDHLMFFKIITTFRHRLSFLSLLNVNITKNRFFRLLSTLPHLTFLVVSHNLINDSEKHRDMFPKRKPPECRLKGLIINTSNNGEDNELTFEALLHFPSLLSSLETFIVMVHPTWIGSTPMESVTSILANAAPTLTHVGFTFGDSEFDDVIDSDSPRQPIHL